MKNTLLYRDDREIGNDVEENRTAIGNNQRVHLLYSLDAVSRPEYFHKGCEKYPTVQGDSEIGNSRGKSAIKGYFHYTLCTRFHVPSTFLRGEKYPTVQGDSEIGNNRGKSAIKGYFHCTL